MNESKVPITEEPDTHHMHGCRTTDPNASIEVESGELISPVLYDLVLWGFTERDRHGQRILRRDIQARLDDRELTERELEDFEGNPLYVGFRCQACWEAAVTLLTYGHHLCARDTRPVESRNPPAVQ
jgi:hypothetical protein